MKTNRLFFAFILTGPILVVNFGGALAQSEHTHQTMHGNTPPAVQTDKITCPEADGHQAHHAPCTNDKSKQGGPAMNEMHKMHGNNQGGHGTHPQYHASKRGSGIPTLPGQDAFGTIQEIITILEADPSTNWSRVDITTLRSHLVDMNRLVMDTDVRENTIDGGLEMTVTGQGRTLQAIQTMVPAHAPMIDGQNGWVVKTDVTTSGAILTVTSADAKQATLIRGLGFYGLMATGSHHQIHHLGLARGDNVHTQ